MENSFYLEHLLIQNFATFKNQCVNFRPGLNTIIGETGSGKSLVLDALQLILGNRADKKIVRKDTDYALIEARFICQDQVVKNFLEIEGYPTENNEIIIKRVIFKNGVSKNYINHLSCTLNFLSHFSRKFIDLVGQFENQKLLSDTYQLHLLDQFCREDEIFKDFQQTLREFKHSNKEYRNLIESKIQREQRLDYVNFQLQEIEALNPSSQDEDDLLKKKIILQNIEKIHKLNHQFEEKFYGSEEILGLFPVLKSLQSILVKNPDIFQDSVELFSDIEDKLLSFKSIIDSKLNIEIDPSEMQDVLDRLDKYQRLKKKFGGSTDTVVDSYHSFKKEKKGLEEIEVNFDTLSEKVALLETELRKKAEKIHAIRLQQSKNLSDLLTKKIRSLKMNGATIKIEIQKMADVSDSGITQVQFLAETNLGEGFFKIKDIASGGELSRILLSIRQILSAHDSISIFLFDEIDTGIGGETGTCIGKALQDVSQNGQVIAITHLPQIAQFADTLIVVQKNIEFNNDITRTESKIREVTGKLIQKEVKLMAQLGN